MYKEAAVQYPDRWKEVSNKMENITFEGRELNQVHYMANERTIHNLVLAKEEEIISVAKT